MNFVQKHFSEMKKAFIYKKLLFLFIRTKLMSIFNFLRKKKEIGNGLNSNVIFILKKIE